MIAKHLSSGEKGEHDIQNSLDNYTYHVAAQLTPLAKCGRTQPPTVRMRCLHHSQLALW